MHHGRHLLKGFDGGSDIGSDIVTPCPTIYTTDAAEMAANVTVDAQLHVFICAQTTFEMSVQAFVVAVIQRVHCLQKVCV